VPQLGGTLRRAMLPDLQNAIQKLNLNLDGLQVTLNGHNDRLTTAIARTSGQIAE